MRVIIISLLIGWLTGCIRPEPPNALTPPVAKALCTPMNLRECLPSPDRQWTAEINGDKGTSLHNAATGAMQELFPADNRNSTLHWSSDSKQLLIARGGASHVDNAGMLQVDGPPQLWQVTVTADPVAPPSLVFEAPRILPVYGELGPSDIMPGDWSPDGRRLLFWVGPLHASSAGSDGVPLYLFDTVTQQATPLADVALLNPRYHSWSPDGSALVYTAGGYRSAQVNKWLNLWNSKTSQITIVVSMTEAIPGIVAWSPRGDWIAYAAVPATETSAELADWGSFDNPAIAGRRIYLLNPTTGETQRLNDAMALQDAPTWSDDGTTLYYVQRDGAEVVLLAADPATGQATTIEASRQPLPDYIGYYGQGEWEQWLTYRPSTQQ